MGFRIGAGIAMRAEEARHLCLLEGVERYSAQYRAGDPASLRSVAIAGAREADFEAVETLLGHPERDSALARVDSRGCAAGNSVADAALRALLETIEFAAVDRWKSGEPLFVAATPAAAGIEIIVGWLGSRGQTQHFLHWRHPSGATVAIAITRDRDGSHPTFGSAARFDPQEAHLHASLESAFASLNLSEIDRRNPSMAELALADRETLAIYRGESELPPVPAAGSAPSEHRPASDVGQIGGDTGTLARLIAGIRQPIAILDLTRPEIGIPVVRAIILPMPGG